MRTNTRLLLLGTALLLLQLSECSRSTQNTPLADQGIDLPAKQVNTSIHIVVAPGSKETYANGGVFYSVIQNSTDTSVTFPPDYGLRVFLKDGKEWKVVQVAIPDNIDMSGPGEVVLPQGQNPAGNYYPVSPILPADHEGPVTLRLVVLGSMGEGLSKQQVAAYTDVAFP